MSPTIRAQKALAHLGESDPALGVLSLWCRHSDADGETRTHGNTIIYGPSFTSFGLAEQVALVAHHVLHVALRHAARQTALAQRLGENFDPQLFGLAADGVINDTLLLAGHALPRPAVLLTELLKSVGRPARSPVEALSEWDVDRLTMLLHSNAQNSDKARKYGNSRRFKQDVAAAKNDVDETSENAAEWRNQMLRALEAGRRAGTGIGQFANILADLAAPSIPWEVQLRGLLATATSDAPRLSFRRPSGRWSAMAAHAQITRSPEPTFQPGRARDAFRPRVVVGLDTSSSIDNQTLSLFFSEIEGVSRRSNAEVHLLAFDEVVHDARRMDMGGWRELHDKPLRTGGGTDYGPVFMQAAGLYPSVLVMLTDLDAELGAAPSFPVIWVVPRRSHTDVPFGRILRLDN